MDDFGVFAIAVDSYPDPPGPLPSSISAEKLVSILTNSRGGILVRSLIVDEMAAAAPADSSAAIRTAFSRWATEADRPLSSVIYLVGHGRGDGLDHEFLVPTSDRRMTGLRTDQLAEYFQREWQSRQASPTGWALFILDCCDSQLGITKLEAMLAGTAPKKPKRLALWPVNPGGGSHAGDFVTAFEWAISTFEENDIEIKLHEIFRRMRTILERPRTVRLSTRRRSPRQPGASRSPDHPDARYL